MGVKNYFSMKAFFQHFHKMKIALNHFLFEIFQAKIRIQNTHTSTKISVYIMTKAILSYGQVTSCESLTNNKTVTIN